MITLTPIHSVLKCFSTSSFFSIPRNGDPEPRLLFEGLDITHRQDICTKHMGKYPVMFCDFKVCLSSLQTFQTTRLRVAESHRQILGGNAFQIQKLSFQPLHGVGRLPHALSCAPAKALFRIYSWQDGYGGRLAGELIQFVLLTHQEILSESYSADWRIWGAKQLCLWTWLFQRCAFSTSLSITVGIKDKYSRPKFFSGVVYFLISWR